LVLWSALADTYFVGGIAFYDRHPFFSISQALEDNKKGS
jgi:hypothetical protein